MALDYAVIGISLVIFIIYIIAFLLLIEIKKRVTKTAGIAVLFFMFALLLLVVRRLQQIFYESQIVTFVPYSSDIITLIFAILFSLGVFFFYKAIKEISRSPSGRASDILGNYRKKFG